MNGISNNAKKKDKIVEVAGDSGPIGKLNNGKRDDDAGSGRGKSKQVDRFVAFDPDKNKKESNKIKVRKNKQNNDAEKKKSKAFRQSASIKKNTALEAEPELSFGDYLLSLIHI